MTCEGNIPLSPEAEFQAKKQEFLEILDRVRQRSMLKRPDRDWYLRSRIVRATTDWVPVEQGGEKYKLRLDVVQYRWRDNLTPALEVCSRDSAGSESFLFNCYDVTGQRWTGRPRIETPQEIQNCTNILQLLEHGLQKAGR